MISKNDWKILLIIPVSTFFVVLAYHFIYQWMGNSFSTVPSYSFLLLALILSILLSISLFFLRKVLLKLNESQNNGQRWQIAKLAEIKENSVRFTDIFRLGKYLLEETLKLLKIDDAQLTLYYDLRFGLEVTNIRFNNGAMQTSVQRVREDDAVLATESGEFLSPLTASHTQAMTMGDRLVGMLFLGSKHNNQYFDKNELALIESLGGLMADVIDKAMMIRSVWEANQRLFESEKLASIGQLASGIAHEIRNPLSSVKMNLQGLGRNENLSKRDSRRVQISLDEIERLDTTIGELMDFARRTNLEIKEISADNVIKQCLDSVRAEIKNKAIHIETILPEQIPTLKIDKNRILNALINLVLNAVQAMENEGILELRVETYEDWIEIQVRDNGPGIEENLRKDIFNPFFTTKAGGTGLGLANAQKYVEEHGGELALESEVGIGTTFFMRLPPEPHQRHEDPSALRVMPK